MNQGHSDIHKSTSRGYHNTHGINTLRKKLINCFTEKSMWWNYPKGLKYSVLPDGLQEKHHLIRTM